MRDARDRVGEAYARGLQLTLLVVRREPGVWGCWRCLVLASEEERPNLPGRALAYTIDFLDEMCRRIV